MSALLIAGLCALWFGLGFWAGSLRQHRRVDAAQLRSLLRRTREVVGPCTCHDKEAPRG